MVIKVLFCDVYSIVLRGVSVASDLGVSLWCKVLLYISTNRVGFWYGNCIVAYSVPSLLCLSCLKKKKVR